MRKRIVIGLLILSVIGTAVFFFSQPWEGAVEWHKREYLEAHRWLNGKIPSWKWRVYALWNRIIVKDWLRIVKYQREKREVHQKALVKLGYLEERNFFASNLPVRILTRDALLAQGYEPDTVPASEFFDMKIRDPNILTVVTTPQDMAAWAEAVRKADSPWWAR